MFLSCHSGRSSIHRRIAVEDERDSSPGAQPPRCRPGQIASTHASRTVARAAWSPHEHAQFCGPSSSEYALNMVSGNLHAMGMPAAILDKSNSGAGQPATPSSRLAHYGPFSRLLSTDPLWEIKKATAVGFVSQWFDGVGSLYPVVSRAKMMDTITHVFMSIERTQKEGFTGANASLVDVFLSDETSKLKMILAIQISLEHGGQNEDAHRLFQTTTDAVESQIWSPRGVSGLQLLILAVSTVVCLSLHRAYICQAFYHYHIDDEVSTGRIIGLASRLCLEMGLHRRSAVEKAYSDAGERTIAMQTFWSVYMLERRTSLGQGIPFSLQENIVDPSLFSMVGDSPIALLL